MGQQLQGICVLKQYEHTREVRYRWNDYGGGHSIYLKRPKSYACYILRKSSDLAKDVCDEIKDWILNLNIYNVYDSLNILQKYIDIYTTKV